MDNLTTALLPAVAQLEALADSPHPDPTALRAATLLAKSLLLEHLLGQAVTSLESFPLIPAPAPVAVPAPVPEVTTVPENVQDDKEDNPWAALIRAELRTHLQGQQQDQDASATAALTAHLASILDRVMATGNPQLISAVFESRSSSSPASTISSPPSIISERECAVVVPTPPATTPSTTGKRWSVLGGLWSSSSRR